MRIPSPLGLLLKYEGYPPAVTVALLLHAGALLFMLERDFGDNDFVDVERPPYISASVIQENPQRVRYLEDVRQQRQAAETAERQRQEEARRQAERDAQAAREREQRETQARAEEERRQREVAQQRQREAEERDRAAREETARQEQQRREQAAREQAAREAEAARQAAAQQQAQNVAAEASLIGTYTAAIRDAVALNWSLPPSARNGMTVVVRIQLVPTGEVVDARVIQSSGDAGFDRSAEQAVRKAGRFPELQGMDIGLFEREFRTINLLFRPEDLLR